MSAHDHAHAHAHGHGEGSARVRALWVAIALNAGLLVAQVVGGIAFGSLALLADGAHLASDVVGLGVAIVALRLADRPATVRHSYGFQRAEVLGAQANAAALLAVTAWLSVEAIQRLRHPGEVDGGGVLVIALVGLVANGVSLVLVQRTAGESLNMRGAVLHLAGDTAGSIGVVFAALAVILFDASWVDPAVTFLIGGLVVWSAWGLLRAATNVLLEASPDGIDPAKVEAALVDDPDVSAVHHLHVWNLASDVPALSGHVVVEGDRTLHEAQEVGDRLRELLEHEFGIAHSTLELECHPCSPTPEHHTV